MTIGATLPSYQQRGITMIHYEQGDIFESKAEAIVNPVNTVGVMGKGLALQFKRRYPRNFRAYAQICRERGITPAKPFLFDRAPQSHPRYIINLATKRHWRDASQLADIESGLKALADLLEARNITSVAIPAIGAGLGQLDWQKIRPLIDQHLADLQDTHITVFQPL